MAQVQTNSNAKAAAAGKRGRAKKGDEPYKLLFVDGENKEHNRVAPGTKAIKAVDKAGTFTSVTMDGLPDAVKNQLAFAGFKRFIEAPLKKDATNVSASVKKVIEDLKAGKLFVSTGKKAGRAFDVDLYVDAFCLAMDMAVERKVQNAKKVSQANREKLKADLESKTPQERNARTKQWMSNPLYVNAKKEIEAQRAKKALGASNDLAGLEF